MLKDAIAHLPQGDRLSLETITIAFPVANQMFSRRTLQQILAELQTLHPRLQLKLPASQKSLDHQLAQLALERQQLMRLRQQVIKLPKGRVTLSIQLLIGMLDQMLQTTQEFTLLAEEFVVDPEGAISCLDAIYQNTNHLSAALDRLQMALR